MRPIITTTVWVAVLVTGRVVIAQPQPTTNAGAARAGNPGVPLPPSPIATIREVLAMTSAERQKYLAGRAPQHRDFLAAKLAEFDELTDDEREARLKSLQLRYYMSLLMKLPATNRNSVMLNVPTVDRSMIEERLRLWDKLTADQQKKFLEHEAVVRTVAPDLSKIPRETPLSTFPPYKRAQIEEQIGAWKALSQQERQQIEMQFRQFFKLPTLKKQRTLEALEEYEAAALRSLDQLPKEERDRYLAGLNKFTGLSSQERSEFLKAAARWKKMNESQRETWRTLANRFPTNPPLPPGFQHLPLPPALSAVRPAAVSSTDTNP
jgi:hypothetical protein